jgi:hypothetical protein
MLAGALVDLTSSGELAFNVCRGDGDSCSFKVALTTANTAVGSLATASLCYSQAIRRDRKTPPPLGEGRLFFCFLLEREDSNRKPLSAPHDARSREQPRR